MLLPEDGPKAVVGLTPEAFVPAAIAALKERRAGLSVSLALHGLVLGLAFLAIPAPSKVETPPPDSVTVEMITPGEFAAVTAVPSFAPLPAVPSIVAPLVHPTFPSPPSHEPRDLVAPRQPLTHAATILSSAALDRAAKASLKGLEGDARFEQLCDIEAMEQITRKESRFTPERAVAYASADTRMEGDTLIADGGAFLSNGHWYHLKFRCGLAPDRRQIVSFDFATGGQFPDNDPSLPTGADD